MTLTLEKLLDVTSAVTVVLKSIGKLWLFPSHHFPKIFNVIVMRNLKSNGEETANVGLRVPDRAI